MEHLLHKQTNPEPFEEKKLNEIKNPYLPIPETLEKPNLASWLKSTGLAVALSMMPDATADSERTTSFEHRAIAIEVMGEDLVKDIEAAGFTIELQVPAPEPGAPYVIHLGQIHIHPGTIVDRIMTDGIVREFQARKESLLEPLATVGGGVVFDEGLTWDQQFLNTVRENVRFLIDDISELAQGEISTEDEIERALAILEYYRRNNSHPFIANTIDSTIVTSIQQKVDDAVAQLPDSNRRKQLFQTRLDTITAMQRSRRLARGDTAGLDSLAQYFINGSIQLAATENEEVNARAIEAERYHRDIYHIYREHLETAISTASSDIRSKIDEFSSLDRELTDEEERELILLRQRLGTVFETTQRSLDETPLGNALLQASREAREFIHSERDQIVFEMIGQYELETNTSLQNVVVRYGNNHDFSIALQRHNQRTNGTRRGLIRLHAPMQ